MSDRLNKKGQLECQYTCRYASNFEEVDGAYWFWVVPPSVHPSVIHVIFSWAQIGRSAIFGREIGVPDREIFSRQKILKFNVQNCLFASP